MPNEVTIILPTYNRARFLPEAFAAIRRQRFTDWELIVVDDGSSDETRPLVEELAASVTQPVRYIYQENQGPYAARNTGLDHASGKYIAFYDSDDIWLPHHLSDCVAGLEGNTEVDWVYGACRIVDYTTQRVLDENTFYVAGKPRPFLSLRSQGTGYLQLIEDRAAVRCQILHGLYCGLQNSVVRRRVFQNYRFNADLRNEAEDQLIVIWALASNFQFGYIDAVHVIYHVHDANSSLASNANSIDKQVRLYLAMANGFERLASLQVLSASDKRVLRMRIARLYFWNIGYNMLWQNGRRREAHRMFKRGLRYYPWDPRFWKTWILAILRNQFLSEAP